MYEDVDELPQIPGVDPPPPPPKANGKGPPKVKGGSFMAVACYAEEVREPDLIGETKVDLTEVLTKGETDGMSATPDGIVPPVHGNLQNGLPSCTRTSIVGRCISN